jgi:PAS domain S-box-containing protein
MKQKPVNVKKQPNNKLKNQESGISGPTTLTGKFGIKEKLYGGFGTIILLFTMTLILSIASIDSLQKNLRLTQEHPLAVTRASAKIETIITAMHRSMKDVAFSVNSEKRDKYIALVHNYESEALDLFDIIQGQILGNEGGELASQVRNAFIEWQPIRQKVIDLMESGEYKKAQQITQIEGHDYVMLLDDEAEKLISYAADKAMMFNEVSARIANRGRAGTIILLLMSLLLGASLSVYFAQSLTGRLSQINTAAMQMAEGDLNQVIQDKSNDELSVLVNSFNTMANQLSKSYEILEQKVVDRTKKLKKSELKFKTSVENLINPFGIYSAVRDESGQIEDYIVEYVNKAACKSNQMTYKEQVGKRLCEILPAHKETGLFEEYGKVVETAKPFIMESLVYEDVYGGKRISKAFDIQVTKLGDGFVASWSDITERKKAEDALNDATQRLSYHRENTPLASIEFDQDNQVIDWSDNAAKMFGWTAKEMFGKKVSQMHWVHEEDVEKVNALSADMFSGQISSSVNTNRNYCKDGSVITCKWYNSAMMNSEGELISLHSMVQNITKREQALKELKESEDKYRTIFEGANDIFIYVNKTGHIIDVNNRKSMKLGQEYSPKGKEKTVLLYVTLKRKDGQNIVVETNTQIIKENKKIRGFVTVFRDVTDRIQAEDELKQAHEIGISAEIAGNLGSWSWDLKTQKVIWSDNLCRIHDIKVDEFDGTIENARKFIHPDDLDYVNKQSQVVRAEKKPKPIEYRIMTHKGAIKNVQSNNRLILDEKGVITQIVGVVQDITQRKQTEKTLQENEEKYRSLFATVADAIIIFDLETTNIVDINSAALKLYGYTENEIKKLTLLDISNEPEKSLQSVRVTSLEKTISIPIRYHKKKDGTIFPVEITGSVFELGNRKVLCGIIRDITERILKDGELSNTLTQLRQLSSRLDSIREEEARRISRELHDEMGQYLTAINLNLQELTEKMYEGDKNSINIILEHTSEIVDETEEKIHELSLELRPLMLDELGLVSTFHWYINKTFSHLETDCSFESTNMKKRLTAELEITFFRVMQETVTNVLRHAKATNVKIDLDKTDKNVIYTISDDGKGFNLQKYSTHTQPTQGLGLIGIKERVQRFSGKVNIESEQKKGTTVKVIIPWEDKDNI